ncbi:MAG: response regulator [Oscillospiraceae bacterium]|jgi:CheY-like chemotaxis protein|nr:response regulator [Oscillospiraceae bacterium]
MEAKPKIVLCDDSITNLRVGKNFLSPQYEVFTMLSAQQMFKCLEKHAITLILLDIDMPEMDGFEAIQVLKASEATSQIPVIFLTGNADDATRQRGQELGAVDFIAKPFTPELLLERVASHLLRR